MKAIGENPVSRPSHYTVGSVEPIDLIMAQELNYLQGNIVKYVCRYKHKKGLEDLKKGLQYMIWLFVQESFPDKDWTVNKTFMDKKMDEYAVHLIDAINIDVAKLTEKPEIDFIRRNTVAIEESQ